MKRWQDWVNLALGAWLFVSPWVLGFASVYNNAALTAWTLGATVVLLAVIAIGMPQPWEEGANALLGVGILASPWLFDFATQSRPMSNAVVVGVLVAAFALWAMLSDESFRQRFSNRLQMK